MASPRRLACNLEGDSESEPPRTCSRKEWEERSELSLPGSLFQAHQLGKRTPPGSLRAKGGA